MAKKSTTGLPTRQKRHSDAEDSRSYLSRAEREARAQRWVLLGIGLALGLALVIIIAGLVVEQLITPNQPIAVVNGETVTTREFDKRVRFERWQSGQMLINVASLYGTQMLTDQSSPFYQQFAQLQPGQEYLIGGQVRDVMVDEILIRKEAEARGLTVDDEAVEARIQEYFGYDPDPEEPAPTLEPSATPTPIVSPTPSPVPTATPEPEETPEPTGTPLPTLTPAPTLTAEELVERYTEFSTEYFDEAAKVSGMTRDELRRVFETQVLRDQLRDVITADIGPSEEQTNARHILVESEPEAQDILTALSEGEDFAELARSASIDTGSGASGGELGWAGPGRYVPEFEDAVLNAEIDAIVGPVQTQFGYHIIQVTAREVRELTEAELEQKKETAFTDWLTEQRDAATIEYPVSYVERTPGEPTLFDLGLLGAATGS